MMLRKAQFGSQLTFGSMSGLTVQLLVLLKTNQLALLAFFPQALQFQPGNATVLSITGSRHETTAEMQPGRLYED